MKVLIDGRTLKDLTASPSVYLINLLKELVEREDLEIYLLSPVEINYFTGKNFRIIKAKCKNNIIWNNFLMPWYAYKCGVDLLFFPKSESCLFPVLGKKIITTVHGMIYKVEPQNHPWFVNLYWRFVGRVASIVSSKIICVSKQDYSDLLGEGYSEKKLQVIPIGYNKNFNKKFDKKIISKVLQKYKLKKYFLQVGKIAVKKNQLFTLGILKDYLKKEDWKLVFLGDKDFDEDYYNQVFSFIEKHGLLEKVVFTGRLDQDLPDMPILLQNAEISFFPSTYEGFGMPTIESIASGTIILASDRGALPEVLGRSNVLSLDEKLWESEVEKILKNVEYCKKVKEKQKELLLYYNWEKIAEEYSKNFYKIVKK